MRDQNSADVMISIMRCGLWLMMICLLLVSRMRRPIKTGQIPGLKATHITEFYTSLISLLSFFCLDVLSFLWSISLKCFDWAEAPVFFYSYFRSKGNSTRFGCGPRRLSRTMLLFTRWSISLESNTLCYLKGASNFYFSQNSLNPKEVFLWEPADCFMLCTICSV